MPRFDKTGPQGLGPMTGRGFGPCVGTGRGMGFGRGLGRYFGWNVPQTSEEKSKEYQAYREALKEELEDVDKAIKDLKKSE